MIELMIVIAIIGILAAIAIPSYQAYVAKSQATRGMEEAAHLKAAIELCILDGHLTIGAGAGECDPQAIGSEIFVGGTQGSYVLRPGTGVPQVTINAGTGEVSVVATFGNRAVAPLRNGGANTITWSRDIDGGWACSSTLDVRYRPSGC